MISKVTYEWDGCEIVGFMSNNLEVCSMLYWSSVYHFFEVVGVASLQLNPFKFQWELLIRL